MRLRLRELEGRELLTAALASGLTALVILLAGRRMSPALALLVPLLLALLAVLVTRPLLCLCLAVGSAILVEGPTFGLLASQAHFYNPFYKRLTLVDLLVLLAALAVALDMLRSSRQPRFPRELRLVDLMLVLGMILGIAVGKSSGQGLKNLVLAENLIFYLLLVPLIVANLDVDARKLRLLLGGAFALAVLKALLGLAEIAAHKGVSIEGSANLTYYEPTANWVVMIALLGIVVAILARFKPPLWMLLGTPLLIASIVLSYRRSFWIATVIGLLLVILLALSPVGRRLLVPTALFLAAGIWFLGSINFQSNSPIIKRAASLAPSSVTKSVEDRYRLDERANVLADLDSSAGTVLTGLGINVPWKATKRPLPVEHEDARLYVHFALLWWWMKLGIFGLIAYPLMLISAARLGWKVWRRGTEAIVRAFGLASLCGVAGLVVAETTATFTGSELRFTVVLGAMIGLLALLSAQSTLAPARVEPEGEDPDAAAPAGLGPDALAPGGLTPAAG